jgi:trehalose-6-phosphate synthase
MPVEEKRSRMRLLRDIVRTYNVQSWADGFLQAALSREQSVPAKASNSAPPHDNDIPLVASASSQDQRIA